MVTTEGPLSNGCLIGKIQEVSVKQTPPDLKMDVYAVGFSKDIAGMGADTSISQAQISRAYLHPHHKQACHVHAEKAL